MGLAKLALVVRIEELTRELEAVRAANHQVEQDLLTNLLLVVQEYTRQYGEDL